MARAGPWRTRLPIPGGSQPELISLVYRPAMPFDLDRARDGLMGVAAVDAALASPAPLERAEERRAVRRDAARAAPTVDQHAPRDLQEVVAEGGGRREGRLSLLPEQTAERLLREVSGGLFVDARTSEAPDKPRPLATEEPVAGAGVPLLSTE